jgi:hypothetical protein
MQIIHLVILIVLILIFRLIPIEKLANTSPKKYRLVIWSPAAISVTYEGQTHALPFNAGKECYNVLFNKGEIVINATKVDKHSTALRYALIEGDTVRSLSGSPRHLIVHNRDIEAFFNKQSGSDFKKLKGYTSSLIWADNEGNNRTFEITLNN